MDVLILVVNILILFAVGFIFFKFTNEDHKGDPESEKKLNEITAQLQNLPVVFREESKTNREEISSRLKENRVENSQSIKSLSDSLNSQLTNFNDSFAKNIDTFGNKLDNLTEKNENKLDRVNQTIENKLKFIQEDNSQQLEKMRATVDEKLHSTLEKRLGESFSQVVEQLEKVHKGIGEMQSLATGVGDLKKVLTNIKSRGVFGEHQLEALLNDILNQTQYSKNVNTNPQNNARVEFAIKFPGRDNEEKPLWLPVDCKFPVENHQRLMEAYEAGDLSKIEFEKKQLEKGIKECAKQINEKYIAPPHTTDFGILFLPFESLYAEVLRIPGLFEEVQNRYNVAITGPATIGALLNSFRMGFRTLAIEKRSSEVWNLLGAIKNQFDQFGKVLIKTKQKIESAGKEIDKASQKTRVINRKLKDVEELPQSESTKLLDGVLEIPEDVEDVEVEETKEE